MAYERLDLSDPDVRAAELAKRKAARAGKKYNRVSAIPEVLKAYQADPKTQLAVQALAQGTSSAPVAQGKYAYADGIARALTGAIGGKLNQRQMNEYGELGDTTLDKSELRAAGEEQAKAQAAAVLQQQAAPAIMGGYEGGDAGVAPPVPPPAPMQQASPQPTPQTLQTARAAASDPQGLGMGQTPPVAPPGPSVAPTALQGGTPGGGSPFSKSYGGLSLGRGRDALISIGAKINSGYRTPEHNASKQVRGVKNSWHTRGTPDNPLAYDFGVGKSGLSMKGLEGKAREAFPGFDVINEGDHVHVEPSARMASAGPVSGGGGQDVLQGGDGQDSITGSGEEDTLLPTPAVAERPTRPTAVAARKSELLNAAYAIMRDRDEVAYGRGQEMYAAGLAEQDKMNEAAAGREQALLSDEFGAGNERWKTSQNNAETNAYSTNREILNDRRALNQAREGWRNTAEQNELNRAHDLTRDNAKYAAAAAKAEVGDLRNDPVTLDAMARELVEGNVGVLTGLGRGAVGSANAIAIRQRAYEIGREMGLTPEQRAHNDARFKGLIRSGQTVGNRVGNVAVAIAEVPGLADEALAKQGKLPRTRLMPLNRAIQMVEAGTASPELAEAVTANKALANAYARSFGGGQLTVHAQEEADKILGTAFGTKAYAAAVAQIRRNIAKEEAGANAALENIGSRGDGAPAAKTPLTDAQIMQLYVKPGKK